MVVNRKKLAMRQLGLILGLLAWAAPVLASAGETITYTYDAQGRLTKVEHAGTVNDRVKAKYSYDDADNRSEVVVTGAPASPAARRAPPKPRH